MEETIDVDFSILKDSTSWRGLSESRIKSSELLYFSKRLFHLKKTIPFINLIQNETYSPHSRDCILCWPYCRTIQSTVLIQSKKCFCTGCTQFDHRIVINLSIARRKHIHRVHFCGCFILIDACCNCHFCDRDLENETALRLFEHDGK